MGGFDDGAIKSFGHDGDGVAGLVHPYGRRHYICLVKRLRTPEEKRAISSFKSNRRALAGTLSNWHIPGAWNFLFGRLPYRVVFIAVVPGVFLAAILNRTKESYCRTCSIVKIIYPAKRFQNQE